MTFTGLSSTLDAQPGTLEPGVIVGSPLVVRQVPHGFSRVVLAVSARSTIRVVAGGPTTVKTVKGGKTTAKIVGNGQGKAVVL